jgi:lipopolysaccharide/colanic/teichoic acid biosynthesis glycosyltransferase
MGILSVTPAAWWAAWPRGVSTSATRGGVRHKDWRLLLAVLVGLDVLAVVLAVVAAGFVRLRLDGIAPVVQLGLAERHLVASILVAPVLLALFWWRGLYDTDLILAGSREYSQIAHAATYGVMIVLGVSFFLGDGPLVSRSWLLLVWLFSVASMGAGRFVARRIVRRLRRHGVLRTRVAIVGASSVGIAVAEHLRAAADEGLDVVGFLDEYSPLGQQLLDDVAVIGRPSDLIHERGVHVADEYILVPQALPHERMEEITRLMVARGGPVLRMAVSSSNLLTNGVLVAERASVPLVTLRRARIAGVDAVLKRTLDVVVAALGLLLLAPLAAVVLVRAYARGVRDLLQGVQIRGVGGEQVVMWLFAREVTSWVSLRGLPALLAVLTGRFSLVGPRPAVDTGGTLAAEELGLMAVKPGLTGRWRLMGPEASLETQAVQDLAYVRDYSLWEDFRILFDSVRCLDGERHAGSLGRWQAAGAITSAMQRQSSGIRQETARVD